MSGVGKPMKAKGEGPFVSGREAVVGELRGGNGDLRKVHRETVARIFARCETCHFPFTSFDPCPNVRPSLLQGRR